MSDLISRSGLLDAFNNLQPLEFGRSVAGMVALRMVNAAPSVDAEPVRHGYWINMQEDDLTEAMWRCSVCGSDRYFDIMTPAECGCYYCPNCGAKMDSEETE